jgi:hypothetical protein
MCDVSIHLILSKNMRGSDVQLFEKKTNGYTVKERHDKLDRLLAK